MPQKTAAAPALAHRDGQEKELTHKLKPIVQLLRAAVKTAAVTLGIYIAAAVAALNWPALLAGALVLNAALGLYFNFGGTTYEDVQRL